MSFTQIIPYDIPANFVFDSSKVEISANQARLKLVDNPLNFAQDFSLSAGFTFDALKTQFSAGTVTQLDQRPANALYYNNFNVDANPTWASGAGTGTLFNAATVSGGKFNSPLSVGASNYLSISTTGVVPTGQKGTIRFTLTTNYNGAPASGGYFLSISKAENQISNFIRLLQIGLNLRIDIYNSTGTSIITVQTGNTLNPVSGVPTEIEIDWDVTIGSGFGVHYFTDGNLIKTTPGTGTRDSNIGLLRLGRDYTTNQSDGLNASIDNLIIFDDVQHTANYTPAQPIVQNIYATDTIDLPDFSYTGIGEVTMITDFAAVETGTPRYTIENKYYNGTDWVASDGSYAQANTSADVNANIIALPLLAQVLISVQVIMPDSNIISSVDNIDMNYLGQIYPLSDPTLIGTSGILTDKLNSITENVTKLGLDDVKYILNFSNVDNYFNGTSWVLSNGTLPQSNTIAEINTNLSLFDFSAGGTIKIKVILHSNDGTTTPDITSNTLMYDFFASQQACTTCLVFGNVLDNCLPVSGASIRIFTTETFLRNNNQVFYDETFITPANGLFELNVPVNFDVPTSEILARIKYTRSDGKIVQRFYKLIVQDTTTCSFETIATES